MKKGGQCSATTYETPQDLIWSSNNSACGDCNFLAKLLDTGNLVICKDVYSEKNVIW